MKLVLGIVVVSIVRVAITSVVGVDDDSVILGEAMVVTSGG